MKISIKMKRILVTFISLAMLLTGTMGSGMYAKASEEDEIYITDSFNNIVSPGQTTHITIPIKSKGYVVNPNISVSGGANSPFDFSHPNMKTGDIKVNSIPINTTTNLEFDVTVDDSVSIKSYPISIKFTYYNYITQANESCTLTMNLKVVDEKTPAQLTISKVNLDSTKIGDDANLSFTVKNEGEITAKSTYLNIDYGNVMQENYTVTKIKIGDLKAGETKDITLPVTILSTASAGKNSLTGNFTYKTSDGDSLNSSYKFIVKLASQNIKAPNLNVMDMQYGKSLKPGKKFTLKVKIKNNGSGAAESISANINSSSITQDGILKNYYTDGIKGSDIKANSSGTVSIPLMVSKYATGGMKNLTVDIAYQDGSGTKYTVSDTLYVDVNAPIATVTPGAPNIVVTNVDQSVAKPEAGDEVDISFDVINNSKIAVKQFKIYADGLTNATFIPVQSNPYQYIEKLAGGKKIRITIPLVISKSITEGLNNLTVKYTYNGGEGSAVIPVRNIKNDAGSSSIPKLIVSKYTTNKKELKAGSKFKLTYDVYNTNSTVAAKNITVTIAQADNVFTVTQGSNSFFINKIDPGETVKKTIEMRVKSDATTKSYPITITIEYEYDGITPNTETGQVGMTKTQTLNLNAEENARPVVDNVAVSTWDGSSVSVGTAATLGFDFYNMGKAVLNNVIVKLEGDGFTKADGTMYFIGNVEAGSSTHVEFDVIPNTEGTANGTLRVSYEDSNGETVEFTKDFTGDVIAAATTSTDDGSAQAANSEAVVAKKDILPCWAFVLIQIAIFIIFVPLTRKVMINAYKSKLRKKEDEQY